MNQAWLIFTLIMAILLFGGGWETRSWYDGMNAAKLGEAQQTNTINAENAVIVKEQKSEQITNQVEGTYDKAIDSIDTAYGMHDNATASNSMPKVPNSSSAANGACYPTKTFKLTPKSCDIVAERLTALQNWVKAQAQ